MKESDKIEEARRREEQLDTVRFDGDIDLDREKTREQLGFKDHEKTDELKIVGTASYANGDKQEFTDSAAFIATIKKELPYRNTTGFQFKVITTDAAIRKAIDDLIYNEYGEKNPRTLEDYKTPESDNPKKKMRMEGRMAAAKAEADRRNAARSDDRPPMAKQLSKDVR